MDVLTTDNRTLPICEVFGPTLQGEGPFTGRLCSFLRFGGCNLRCHWCDSAFTWDSAHFALHEEITMCSAKEILATIPPSPICVVTGGEPLLYQRRPQFIELLEGIAATGHEIHVETNGTIAPTNELKELVGTFVVSPKLPFALAQRGQTVPALNPKWDSIAHDGRAHLKVVVQSELDVAATVRMAIEHCWDFSCVWIMPEGATREALERRWKPVCEWAIAYGINASHRLHVLAWGNDRGH